MFEKRDLHVGICVTLLHLINLGLANGSVTVTPSNTAVVAGNWMAMECRSTNGSTVYRWTLLRRPSSRKEFIYMNYSGAGRLGSNYSYYGVDVDEHGSGLLYLNATKLDDAGLYTCDALVDGEQLQSSAHLIVFESDPLCESNYTVEDNSTLTKGDVIWMQCSVNFRGMWTPTVEWKQHIEDDEQGEDDQQVVLHGVSTVTVLNSSVTSTFTYISGPRKTRPTYFSCRMFFQWHNINVNATASNLPNYTYTWKSPRLVQHREKLKTGGEVYVPPLPAEVGLPSPTTPQPSGLNDWYIISLLLLFAVLVFVSLLIGLGIRRYVRSRRVTDLNVLYNASTASTVPLRRFEGPSSVDYDIVPTATPNIYERIDGADAVDDVIEQQATASCNNHPPLKECYSGLIYATGNATCQYDTLDQYEKMDLFHPATDQTAKETSEFPGKETGEERYTTPVSKRAVVKPSLPSDSSDYIKMVGSVKKREAGIKLLYADLPKDSDDDDYPDGKLKPIARDSDDYLQPGPKAVDNVMSEQEEELAPRHHPWV